MKRKHRSFASATALVALVAATFFAGANRGTAADNPATSAEKQRQLIAVLQSDAPPAEKAITCKRLAIYGTSEAVPALAPLLADAQLSSWARIALEAIPGPAAEAALRDAMGKVQGRLLIGVINSIGVRRDAKAVDALVQKLADPDAEVVSAAAEALGRIGGDAAAKALTAALAGAPAGARSSVAEGCILCAEQWLGAGKRAEAIKLYDTVRQADVPKHRALEATRGAILARQSGGIPLLLEQLRSPDKAVFGIGLRVARELPGRDVTEALAAELTRLTPEPAALLLVALGDRRDDAVLPAVLKAAQSGSPQVKVAAARLLEHLGNASTVPVLLEAATANDDALAKTAKLTLARMTNPEVDAALLARLPQATGKTRQVLIELAGQRRIESALPAIVRCTEDADPAVRGAALDALATMGKAPQAADLVRLLQASKTPQERAEIEKALMAVSSRSGTACVPHLLPLARSNDSALRTIALQALASVGGPEALAVVKNAVNDPDASLQDEAVRTLSTWPNNWPDDVGVAEPLLALVKSGKKRAHQVLGFRGYLQSVQGDKKLSEDERVAKIKDLLPLIQWPEEKQSAIAALGAIPTASALDLLGTFAADPATTEEACSAVVSLVGKNPPGIPKEARQKALQGVVEKTKNDATRKKADDALKGLK